MANKQMHHLKVGDNIFEIVDSVARSGISGAPTIVSLSSAMNDTSKLYLYIGSETGYTSGDWYYHNGTSWVSGGQYGDMQLDTSLTTSGMAADAKSVGDRFNSFATTATAGQAPIADGQGGWAWGDVETGDSVPTEVRQAILALFQNGVYTRDDMSDEVAVVASWASEVTSISVSPTTLTINGMEQETIVATTQPAGGIVTWSCSDTTICTVSGGVVTPTGVNGSCVITATCGGKSASCNVTVSGFATLLSISAVYTQSGTVYDTDTLDSLRSDLVVTANYDDDRSLPVTDYVLSGTLAEGTSVITVTYGGKTATFNVTVTSATLYSLENHTFNNANPIATGLKLLENDRDITFVFDVDFAGQQSNAIWKLFGCINGSGNYEGVTLYAYSNSSDNALIQNMSNRITLTYNLRNYIGNFKYIVTHEAGTNKWHYYYKIGSSSVVDAIDTSPFVSVTGQLTIGGTASGSQVFNGTVNTAKVYSKVLTDSEINTFMG